MLKGHIVNNTREEKISTKSTPNSARFGSTYTKIGTTPNNQEKWQ